MARNLFDDALKAEGITGPLADLARSVYKQESGDGKNTKTSNAGAHGGMQIIPDTFKSVADKDWDINDPMQNARAGIRYLKQLDKQSGGDPALTAAGYYGGPGGLEKARRGIAVSDPRNPKAPNTLEYGAQVAARLGKGAAPSYLAQSDEQFAQATLPQAAAQPAPVLPMEQPVQPAIVAAAQAQPVAPAAPVQGDAWADWNANYRKVAPVQVAGLGYGNQEVPQVQTPDFMSALASLGQRPQVNFQGFAPLRARV